MSDKTETPPVEPYPEHIKLRAIAAESNAIGNFLDWLKDEKKFVLAEYGDPEFEEDLRPAAYRTEDLLAEYYDIDLRKLDAEKRAMLEEFRKL